MLRERVGAATEGDGWVTDSTYRSMLGDLVYERADTFVWLDLPTALVMWRLLRRSHVRETATASSSGTATSSPAGASRSRWLIWPAFKRCFQNRREYPTRLKRYPNLDVRRLRSDAEVRAFVQSIQATATMSGSSGSSDRQKMPPLAET